MECRGKSRRKREEAQWGNGEKGNRVSGMGKGKRACLSFPVTLDPFPRSGIFPVNFFLVRLFKVQIRNSTPSYVSL